MAQEYRPGEIVPQSGIYTITHDPAHADMPHEITVIKGRRFPTCRHCKGISLSLPTRRSMSASHRITTPPETTATNTVTTGSVNAWLMLSSSNHARL